MPICVNYIKKSINEQEIAQRLDYKLMFLWIILGKYDILISDCDISDKGKRDKGRKKKWKENSMAKC